MAEDAADGPTVEALARAMVAAAAPAELPAFRAISQDRGRGRAGGRGSPLSFGPGEALLLVTPVALAAAAQVFQYVVEVVAEPVVDRVVRRLSGGGDPGGEPPGDGELTLTAEQWQRVRQIVIDTAVEAGVEEPRARLMADAVVGRGQAGGQQ